MSVQPPPPPPAGDEQPAVPPLVAPQPPAPLSGGYPPPSGLHQPARSAFDPKTVNPLDWAILGIGLLVFIFSFFGYYTWSVSFMGYGNSVSYSAWHFGGGTFVAWFAMALGVAAAAALALELFAPTVKLPVAGRMANLGLFAVSFLLYLIAIFAHEDFGSAGGHGFSFWVSLVFVLAGAVLALMRLQQLGQPLPGALAKLPNLGAQAPGGQDGGPAGHMAPPPPGSAR